MTGILLLIGAVLSGAGSPCLKSGICRCSLFYKKPQPLMKKSKKTARRLPERGAAGGFCVGPLIGVPAAAAVANSRAAAYHGVNAKRSPGGYEVGAHFLREKVFSASTAPPQRRRKQGKDGTYMGETIMLILVLLLALYGCMELIRRAAVRIMRPSGRVPAFWCCPSPATAAMWNIRSAPPRPRTVGAGK